MLRHTYMQLVLHLTCRLFLLSLAATSSLTYIYASLEKVVIDATSLTDVQKLCQTAF